MTQTWKALCNAVDSPSEVLSIHLTLIRLICLVFNSCNVANANTVAVRRHKTSDPPEFSTQQRSSPESPLRSCSYSLCNFVRSGCRSQLAHSNPDATDHSFRQTPNDALRVFIDIRFDSLTPTSYAPSQSKFTEPRSAIFATASPGHFAISFAFLVFQTSPPDRFSHTISRHTLRLLKNISSYYVVSSTNVHRIRVFRSYPDETNPSHVHKS